jgi:hypothetical protein
VQNRQRNKAAIALGSDVGFEPAGRFVSYHGTSENDLILASEIERIGVGVEASRSFMVQFKYEICD